MVRVHRDRLQAKCLQFPFTTDKMNSKYDVCVITTTNPHISKQYGMIWKQDTAVQKYLKCLKLLNFLDQYLQNKDDIITKIILECTENYGSVHKESKEIAESEKLSGEPESTDSADSTGPPTAKRLKGLATP